jgi:hypothetical protein
MPGTFCVAKKIDLVSPKLKVLTGREEPGLVAEERVGGSVGGGGGHRVDIESCCHSLVSESVGADHLHLLGLALAQEFKGLLH